MIKSIKEGSRKLKKDFDFSENEIIKGINQDQEVQLKLHNNEMTWGKFSLFFVMYIAIMIGATIFASVISIITERVFNIDLLSYIQQIQYSALMELLVFILTLLALKHVREFLKGKYNFQALKKWQTYVYLVVAYVVIYTAQYLIIHKLEWEQGGSQVGLFGLDEISLNIINVLLLIVAFVVIAPITEEVIFRGLILGFLREKIGIIPAILISSLLFGLGHPGHHLSTTIMGLTFGLLYDRTKSIAVPIVFHMIWNAFATYGILSLVASG